MSAVLAHLMVFGQIYFNCTSIASQEDCDDNFVRNVGNYMLPSWFSHRVDHTSIRDAIFLQHRNFNVILLYQRDFVEQHTSLNGGLMIFFSFLSPRSFLVSQFFIFFMFFTVGLF